MNSKPERIVRAGRPLAQVLAAWLVGLITLAFLATGALLLRAKWLNFDPAMLDFAKGTKKHSDKKGGCPSNMVRQERLHLPEANHDFYENPKIDHTTNNTQAIEYIE